MSDYQTYISLPGDVWEVVNDHETGLDLGYKFIVESISEDGSWYNDLNGKTVDDYGISEGWFKRIK